MGQIVWKQVTIRQLAVVAAMTLVCASEAAAQKLDAAVNEQAAANRDAAASQQKIDQLADQTRRELEADPRARGRQHVREIPADPRGLSDRDRVRPDARSV